MSTLKLVGRVIEVLEERGVPYLVVGSYSTNAHGVPRSTRDLDVVVDLSDHTIHEIARDLGDEFRLDPQKTFEGVNLTYRYVVEAGGDGFEIDFFLLSEDAHDRVRFHRGQRVFIEAFGREVVLQNAEDLVVTKLRWALAGGRVKDRLDLDNVIMVSGPTLDWDYVYGWADQHGTRELLDAIRDALPDID